SIRGNSFNVESFNVERIRARARARARGARVKAGPYELEEKIGEGGMGTVWRGRAPTGETVAVKLLPSLAGAEARARFERERRLLAQLGSSAGFVPLLDGGDGPSGPYLVMPLVPGGTLRDRLERGPLGVEATLALGRALARTMG